MCEVDSVSAFTRVCDLRQVYHLHYDTLEMAVAHRTSATGEAEKVNLFPRCHVAWL